MATIGEMKDIYTVARYVKIPGEAIDRFVKAMEAAGYEIKHKSERAEADREGTRPEASRVIEPMAVAIARDWLGGYNDALNKEGWASVRVDQLATVARALLACVPQPQEGK